MTSITICSETLRVGDLISMPEHRFRWWERLMLWLNRWAPNWIPWRFHPRGVTRKRTYTVTAVDGHTVTIR